MDDLKSGDLLFLTLSYERYIKKKYPNTRISLINRLAKLEEVIDWNTSKGQLIKQARIKSGKWKNLPIEENKYIISIYYHDLIGRKGERGVVERGVPMFRYHPKTKKPFFEKVPDWVYQEIMKQCENFEVENKGDLIG